MVKKISLFCTLLLLSSTFNTYTMKRQREGWVETVGEIISEGAPIQELLNNCDFNELLPELKQHIIILLASHSNAETLEEAAFTINSLAQVNKELNELINDPQLCLTIIKNLASRFNTTDQHVTNTLQTKAAKERSNLQDIELDKVLLLAPENPDYESILNNKLDALCKKGIDLNYTDDRWDHINTEYDPTCIGMTPLMLAIRNNNNHILLDALLKKGADINAINPCGRTALMVAVAQSLPETVQFLINQPNINLDQQEFEFGDTALSLACEQYEDDLEDIEQKILKRKIVEILLNGGADPEAGDPLYYAEKNGAEESALLIKEAIDKKYGK